MIYFRPGLSGAEISDELLHALRVAHQALRALFKLDLYVTSVHGEGRAADLRLLSWFVGFNAVHDKSFRQQLGQALGSDYDVVLQEDHIHVEYDPKP